MHERHSYFQAKLEDLQNRMISRKAEMYGEHDGLEVEFGFSMRYEFGRSRR